MFLIVFIGVIISLGAILTVISHAYYKRSNRATIVELYLRFTKKKGNYKKALADVDNLSSRTEREYVIPNYIKKGAQVGKEVFCDMQNFVFKGKNDIALIYLHGAGYVRPPRKQHYKLAYKLNKLTGANVYFAHYPKAPKHTFAKSYQVLTELYLNLKQKYKKIYISGDSSGGGLALGLAEDFLKNGVAQPDGLILISPCVDVGFNNNQIIKYQSVDPLICRESAKLWGKLWAGNEDVKHYKVSPLYGDMVGLCQTHVFIGTREILYPDVKLLYSILMDSGVKTCFYVGQSQNHCYPLFPIPEGKKAISKIAQIIK